jgi:hypothetical protein
MKEQHDAPIPEKPSKRSSGYLAAMYRRRCTLKRKLRLFQRINGALRREGKQPVTRLVGKASAAFIAEIRSGMKRRRQERRRLK